MGDTTLTVTILGCGSSGGVPRIGNHWGACDPNEPKNRRRRCSLLVQQFGPDKKSTDVIIDTSPDLREQLIDAGLGRVDAILYTHDHADQAHGIDDLRQLAIEMRKLVDIYADEGTLKTLMTRFSYCFASAPGSDYPPILKAHIIHPYRPVTIHGPGGTLEFMPFTQTHGRITSLGFRCGPLAYSADVDGIPEESFAVLEGVECWIVDALRYRPHPSHAHVARTLEWIARVKPERAVLTDLHVDLDYATLKRQMPPGVEPAYDGMRLTFPHLVATCAG